MSTELEKMESLDRFIILRFVSFTAWVRCEQGTCKSIILCRAVVADVSLLDGKTEVIK